MDVTATPKHNNGAIFVQTVADYPLVEAISQNVVKHPVLPDAREPGQAATSGRAPSTPRSTPTIMNLGVIEWRKAYAEHEKLGKKAILFVMTDDTKNCDDVAAYLEGNYPDLKGAVLVIHTKNNGEISEANVGKSKEELEKLRKQANEIDEHGQPVQGDRLGADAQGGLGRAQRDDDCRAARLYRQEQHPARANAGPRPAQDVSGRASKNTSAWSAPMPSWISSNRSRPKAWCWSASRWAKAHEPKTPLVVEVDKENEKKDLDALDIEIPVMTPRIYREYKNLKRPGSSSALGTSKRGLPAIQRGGAARDRIQGHRHRRSERTRRSSTPPALPITAA